MPEKKPGSKSRRTPGASGRRGPSPAGEGDSHAGGTQPTNEPAKTGGSKRSGRTRTGRGSRGKPGDELAGRESQEPASRLIDRRIRELEGWRGKTLARMRALIHEAAPAVKEEWKWRGTPVWSQDGILCTGETYTSVVKLTFAHGAELPDPSRLFNASLEGSTRRAIDIHEGEEVDAPAFRALVQAAVTRNQSGKKATVAPGEGTRQVKLLSGGNPQIPKEDGDAPVQAYIEALESWKRDLARRVDALVEQTVPGVEKAVKWNSPLYGVPGQGWFLGIHTFTRYIKLTFFCGTSLRPVPPGGTPRSKDSRWIDLRENEPLDEAQLSSWFQQSAKLPGWSC